MNHTILENIKESLDRYVNERIETGGFLRTVLANDLMEALGRADSRNRLILHDICRYLYNELPSACHGSYELVDKWLSEKQ